MTFYYFSLQFWWLISVNRCCNRWNNEKSNKNNKKKRITVKNVEIEDSNNKTKVIK